LCDSCGYEICGVNWYCFDCNIALCFLCGILVMQIKDGFPIRCPMCDKEME